MKITRVSRSVLLIVPILIVLLAPAPSSAQDLVVARAESLNEVLAGLEEISSAAGKGVSREMVLGMGTQIFGSDPKGFLDLDRPVAALMPVEGMMMMQNGVVVSVPVTDAAAAIEAFASLFPNHTVEGELHTFTSDQGPALYLTAADGYVKVGGNASLVTRLDPLAYETTGSTLSVELFLEPIAPMIEANLGMAKAQIVSSMEAQAEGETEAPYDAATMGTMLDAYFDGIRWMLANTKSVRLRLDIDDGYVRFAKDLLPKPDSDLAGFIEAQKGGLPEIAKLVDQKSAWYMAGQVHLTDQHREGLKKLVSGYIDLLDSMVASQAESADTTTAEALTFWSEYMDLFGPYAGRWIDCLRGDVVASFDFPPGQPMQFIEAFGFVEGDECTNLVSEMSDELVRAVGSAEEMSDAFTVAKGPEIGGSESLVMTFDMVKMLDEMGQPSQEQAEAMIKAMYGEQMSGALVSAGDVVLATGGPNAIDRLGGLAAMLPMPGKAPSFAPLEVRPGFMFGLNLGATITWLNHALPEGTPKLEGAAERLNGDVGRIPMAGIFGSKMATFEIAVSLETIEAINSIVQEQRAQAAEGEGD